MKCINKDSQNITMGAFTIQVIPELLALNENPETIVPVIDARLKNPVVTGGLIKYNNMVGIKYARYHNLYKDPETDKFFFDVLGEKFYLEDDLTQYNIKRIKEKHGYTVYNAIQ